MKYYWYHKVITLLSAVSFKPIALTGIGVPRHPLLSVSALKPIINWNRRRTI